MSDKKTKAELLAMLAEAVRNTQPQSPIGAAQPDPQPELKRKTGPVSKRKSKTKKGRASARRKARRR